MSAIDTPDYQRGIVSAQILLGQAAGGDPSLTVGLPVNVETLVVIADGGVTPQTSCLVAGLQSGISYQAYLSNPGQHNSMSRTWFVDVTSVIDQTMSVTIEPPASSGTWAYADLAAHVTFDTSKLTSDAGLQYVVPSVPSTLVADHPPYELLVTGAFLSTSQPVIGAPGVGRRNRVYSMNVASAASGLAGYLADSVSSGFVMVFAGPATAAVTLPGQGYPLQENAALDWLIEAGSGTAYIVAFYTIESI